MKKIVVIDYGMGNIDSIVRAVEECAGNPFVTNDPHELESASSIILPGVGAFGDGIGNIRRLGLDKVLNIEVLERKTPFLGICLGMQLLATIGTEGGKFEGLGWIDGEVKRLEPNGCDARIPHVGWNEVRFKKHSLLFKNIPSGKDFYFVHSYHFVPKDRDNILSETPYCGSFVSSVSRDNIFGVQFHPEKSQRFGLLFLRNFLEL